ncbi:MAG: undecaprenyl-diphosphate phosphatase [Myxococcales bacterium]|nr:undecaprenyl-diphosphate phosphatase [Myxococcales bacterium]
MGIVEGLTEFVPVSSTGHLILTSAWLGLDVTADQKAAVDAFDIVIQAGAWLACCLYYMRYIGKRLAGVFSDDVSEMVTGWRLIINLMVAFVPVVIVGLLFRKAIKAVLFGPLPVAIALAIGGVVMLFTDRLKREDAIDNLDQMTMRQAMVVGLAQCFALIPGTSRSMSTIIGGMASGLSARAAADFSFLLAIPVLGSATAYELLKEWHVMSLHIGWQAMIVGLVASFVVGWASISVFLRIIVAKGLSPFGVYRILLAGLVWWTLLRGAA